MIAAFTSLNLTGIPHLLLIGIASVNFHSSLSSKKNESNMYFSKMIEDNEKGEKNRRISKIDKDKNLKPVSIVYSENIVTNEGTKGAAQYRNGQITIDKIPIIMPVIRNITNISSVEMMSHFIWMHWNII